MFNQRSNRKHVESGVPADIARLREASRELAANRRSELIQQRHQAALLTECSEQEAYTNAARDAVEELRNNWRNA